MRRASGTTCVDAESSGATYRDRVSETAVDAPSAPERTWSAAAWLFALFGVLAAAFGVAIGTLVAALVDPAYSPIEVVASTAIDLPPQAVKEWATSTFGTASKSVVVGVVVVAVITVMMIALSYIRMRTNENYLLVLHYDPAAEQEIDAELHRGVRNYRIRSKTITRSGAEMTVDLRLNQRADIVSHMLDIQGVYDATLVAVQNETAV